MKSSAASSMSATPASDCTGPVVEEQCDAPALVLLGREDLLGLVARRRTVRHRSHL